MDNSSAENVERYRKIGYEMVDLICNYFKQVDQLNVVSTLSPLQFRSLLPIDPPQEGEEFKDIAKDIEGILIPGLTHWQHPSYFASASGSASFPSMLGDMLSSGIGVQGMMWITSPACTELETHVVDWVAKLLKLPTEFLSPFCGGKDGGGVIQGSTVEAILSVLVAARWRQVHQAVPTISNLDVSELTNADMESAQGKVLNNIFTKLVAYSSEHANSAVRKSCLVAGVRHMRLISCDELLSIVPEKLEAQIKDDISQGFIPAFVCIQVGVRSRIKEIGDICRRHNIWLHVDGAQSGSFGILPELQDCLSGIELADSFNISTHKALLTNFDCSPLWVKERKALVDALTVTPEYLRNKATDGGGVYDYKDWGVPLGRRFRSLKLWFALRMFGVEEIRTRLRKMLEISEFLETLIVADGRFEPVPRFRFAAVHFRLKSSEEDAKQLWNKILAEKKVCISHVQVHNRFAFRVIVANGITTAEHLRKAWEFIQETTTSLFPDQL